MSYWTAHAITLGRGVESVVGGHRIRFHPRWSRYYEPDYEPETFLFLRDHLSEGKTYLDVGGHIGLFAIIGAQLVGDTGKVFTFEPTPYTGRVLAETVRLNHFGHVIEVRYEAVSRESGTASFFDTGDLVSNANSLVKIPQSMSSVKVNTVSIDQFVEERSICPDCIKIDVEGAELEVLIGAKETLTSLKPAVRLGLHPEQIKSNGQSLEDIWNVIEQYGMFAMKAGSTMPKREFCSNGDLFDVNLKHK